MNNYPPNKLLFVDDDRSLFVAMTDMLRPEFDVLTAESAEDALSILESNPDIGYIVSDVCMPGLSGLDLVKEVKIRYGDSIKIILVTGFGSISDACEAIRVGAEDYLMKPVERDVLRAVLFRICHRGDAVTPPDQIHVFCGMVAASQQMKQMWESLELYADGEANVLIDGETGTGKELVAEAIHRLSPRHDQTLIKFNCAAVPDTLLESELFGHEKGAFTGASQRKIGRFEQAHKGTLFLDEIGETSPMMQVKLLRVLQEGEFQRLGGNETIKVDVRVVSATNKSLESLEQEGLFRQDLKYRLNTLHLLIPPLRSRVGDIELLAKTQLVNFAKQYKRTVPHFSDELIAKLSVYPWPGNVRELFNSIERAFVLSKESGELKEEFFQMLNVPLPKINRVDEFLSLVDVEKAHISYILKKNPSNKSMASQVLGISRDTLYRKIKLYQLDKS